MRASTEETAVHAKNRKLFLLTTACLEAATGLGLLLLPSVLFAVLFGSKPPEVDAIFIARVAGVALFAIGIASWMARTDTLNQAQRGLLTGILVYNVAVSALLTFAGSVLMMRGVLLWPAVALHATLAVWCFSCLRPDTSARHSRSEAVDRWTPKN
jgi:hypothetical protein